jgi:hypothetical protein
MFFKTLVLSVFDDPVQEVKDVYLILIRTTFKQILV